MAPTAPTKRAILVINPNTTEAMTDGLKPLIDSLGYKPVS
jgi:Asp/Glu/hydantoin racemase